MTFGKREGLGIEFKDLEGSLEAKQRDGKRKYFVDVMVVETNLPMAKVGV